MGMSTHVVGIRPADGTFAKMANVWNACKAAGVPVPKAVTDFFDGEGPEPGGVRVDVTHDGRGAVSVWKDAEDAREGYEVDLTKLDPTVKVLRFYNSW